MRSTVLATLLATTLCTSAVAADVPGLKPAFDLDVASNGLAISGDGRMFLTIVRDPGDQGPRLVERVAGALKPYPDIAWNAPTPADNPANTFVAANSVRVGSDGRLWVVDIGAPGMGKPKYPGGPKIVEIDLATDTARRIYSLDSVTNDKSFIDDIRFNGRHAYITDAGWPGIVVLDLDSGIARRAIDNDPSVVATPQRAEGRELKTAAGAPVLIHADQLEVSPDGSLFYFEPSSGPISKIETKWLDDATLTPAEVAKHIVPFAKTGSTGGTAMDAAGTLYTSATDSHSILAITPAGEVSTLVADPRLIWGDAMWIDASGTLWIPDPQIDRAPAFNGGKDARDHPFHVYTVALGVKPLRR